jgi:hypothetical protein
VPTRRDAFRVQLISKLLINDKSGLDHAVAGIEAWKDEISAIMALNRLSTIGGVKVIGGTALVTVLEV